MSHSDLPCCFIPEAEQDAKSPRGCQHDAEFEIIDLDDYTEQAGTFACTEHVGEMLGHSEGSGHSEGDMHRWEVQSI